MCIKIEIWLYKTHAFENKSHYHKVDYFKKGLGKLYAGGGCGGGGWMEKNNYKIIVILLYYNIVR